MSLFGKFEREHLVVDPAVHVSPKAKSEQFLFHPSRLQMNNILDKLGNQLDPRDPVVNSGVAIEARILAEQDKWNGRKETDSSMYETLKQYWDHVGVSSWTPSSLPWSAAWVSYMLREHIQPQAAHWRYVDDTIAGRNPGWRAYRIADHPNIEINEGDIVVRKRGSGTADSAEFYQTHGDIVATVTPTRAITYGGNLSDSMAKSGELKLEDGRLIDAKTYVIVLKKEKKRLFTIGIPLLLVIAAAGGLFWWVKKK